MKVFFLCGPNPKNVNGMSCKVWKIQRVGRTVTTLWGRANIINRKVKPIGELQSKPKKLPSADAAADFERVRIASKLAKGYGRKPKRQLG